jgi:antitoxin component YwqK of YwqJK toxin-antitoxin module
MISFLSVNAQTKSQNKSIVKKNTTSVLVKKNLRPAHIAPFEISNNGDTINITDDNNYKQGYWEIKTPPRFSELGMLEVGKFLDNKKTGYWETYEGHSIVSKEHFKDNILDGAVLYYDEDRVVTKGFYKGIDPTKKFDTVNVYNPKTNMDTVVIMLAQKGSIKSGDWQYYDNGKIFKTETYFLGELYDTKYENNILPADTAYVNKRKQYLEQGFKTAPRPFSKYSKGKGVNRYTDLPTDGKGVMPNVRVKNK